MTWVRRDDQASIHRKVAPLDDATYRLWSEAIEWCSRNGTDGRIAADELTEIKRGTPTRARTLVHRQLWHEAGHTCDSRKCPPTGRDGWMIHDYLDYNPSKAQVKADLEAKAERTRRWRERKARDGARDAARDGVRDASRDTPVMLPRPVPPRPAPKEGGAGAPQSTADRPAADAAAGGRSDDPPTSRPEPPWTHGQRRAELAAQVRAAAGIPPKAARRARAETPPVDVVDNPHYDPTALDRLVAEPTPKETDRA